MRRAEGYWKTRQMKRRWQVPVKLRRPPSLPLTCINFPAYSSFSVFRETPHGLSHPFQKAKLLGRDNSVFDRVP